MSDSTPPNDKPDVSTEDQVSASPTGEELPPLPDGGLSGAMPTWLQQAPSRPARRRAPETVDLSSLTDGVEVPEWLSNLSRRVEARSAAGQQPEERPLAEAVVKDAPEVGEPEAALSESDAESVDSVAEAGDDLPSSPSELTAESPESTTEPEPELRFRLRSPIEAVQRASDADGVSTPSQTPPVMHYQMRAPAPQPPRSVGATLLLVLLLIALAVVGIWYYWM